MLAVGAGVDLVGLRPDVRADLESMAREYYAATKKPIPVNSAFRSFSKQDQLFRENPGRAAAPGRSMHNYGYAFDTNSVVADDLAARGLLSKYRFSRPVRGEAWHVERAGLLYDKVRSAAAVVSLVVVLGFVALVLSK